MGQDQGDDSLCVYDELSKWARELWESGEDLDLAQAIVCGQAAWSNALASLDVWDPVKENEPAVELVLPGLEVVERRLNNEEASAPRATRYRIFALRFVRMHLLIPASRLVGRLPDERDLTMCKEFIRSARNTPTSIALKAALRLVDRRYHEANRIVIARGESLCREDRAELRRVAQIPGPLGCATRALLAAADLSPIAPIVDAAWLARDEAKAAWRRAFSSAFVQDFPDAIPRQSGPLPRSREHDRELPAEDRQLLERVAASADADSSAAARAISAFVLRWGQNPDIGG